MVEKKHPCYQLPMYNKRVYCFYWGCKDRALCKPETNLDKIRLTSSKKVKMWYEK